MLRREPSLDAHRRPCLLHSIRYFLAGRTPVTPASNLSPLQPSTHTTCASLSSGCFLHQIPCDSRARSRTARCFWRTPLDVWQLFLPLLARCARTLFTPHARRAGKAARASSRGDVRLFHNSPGLQLFHFPRRKVTRQSADLIADVGLKRGKSVLAHPRPASPQAPQN